MTAESHALVIVTPVYEDTASATILFRTLKEQCTVTPYVVAVEDGSVRNPLAISSIAEAGLSGEIIYLARNMGHQRAIATGLAYVAANLDAETVVVLDCDGEDMPEAISPLLDELKTQNVDAVVAQRRKRSETLGFRTFYVVYRHLFGLLTGRTIRFGNFTALNMFAVKRLVASTPTRAAVLRIDAWG